jgi:hypothetical protein
MPRKPSSKTPPSPQKKVDEAKRPKWRPDNIPWSNKLPRWLTLAEAKATYVRVLRKKGSHRVAQAYAGVSRTKVMMWRDTDAAFDTAVKAAWETVVDELEGAVMGRAIHGYEEPVYQGGEMVGTRMKHDPSIQIFMLKTNRPEKYGDKVTINVAAEEYAAQVRDALAAQDKAASEALAASKSAPPAKAT